ncbi:nucleoside hydrolase [Microbacterium esteraromaticum]|uniref:Nucleoside hydrolase n=1 Tax=Microbacterium esteraromaticum TaxID=57043 RepID=A0A7D8AKC7_9MICO|nr:nucleoside hydrolase [Microbacterium esteraromaticum]QMU96268.1 nucleoside hydrolase [Microbacterium esteraromaticum]
MTETRTVILDTDIGTDVDDLLALALILGDPGIDLHSVTTVYGDTVLRARLAARILGVAGADVPVHAGRAHPLSGKEVWWAGHEGALHEGLENETIASDDAVAHLVSAVLAAPGRIDLIAIGPLTNVAAAIQHEPRFAGAVRHLWIMGGSFGAHEPEHNFRSDTAAAGIVFASGIPTTVTGLEITRLINIGSDGVAAIAGSGPLGRLIEAEIRQWWAFWGTEWNVPHDPVTVLTMTAPELFRFSAPGTLSVNAIDGASAFHEGGGAVRVAIGADAAAVAGRIISGIASIQART